MNDITCLKIQLMCVIVDITVNKTRLKGDMFMKKAICMVMAVLTLMLTLGACAEKEPEINTENLPAIMAGVTKGKSPQDEVIYGLELHFPEYGYKLEYKEYDNGKQALEALEKGEIDFSLIATKKDYTEYGSEALVNMGPVYFYPMAIYLKTWDKVANIEDGATIALPDDAENMARALLLLEENGYITLKEGAGLEAKLEDVEKNERGFELKAVAHNEVASSGADIFVMGSLEASASGYERGFDAYVSETTDSEAAALYATSFIIRKADLKTEKMNLIEKYFFTRRMYQAIDGSTDNIIQPMFSLK